MPAPAQVLRILDLLLDHPRTTRMPSIAVYGDSGMGKTMIMQRFRDQHPPLFDSQAGVERTRVLALQLAGKPGERRLYAQILTALGVPQNPRAAVVELEQVAIRLMRAMDVQVLLLDEVHNILAGTFREQRIVLPKIGEKFVFKTAAAALRILAEKGVSSFYEGELAEKIAAFNAECGGAMTRADLASYRPEWVTPISKRYRGYDVHEMPPNGQGVAALIALGILEKFDVAGLAVDGVESQHLQIEAMKLAFADIYRYVADPRSMDVTPAEMLDDGYLATRAKLIDMNKAQSPGFGMPHAGGTIYLTAADESGMMISFIQSNYRGFGSGVVVPEVGISLQNRGFGFSMDPRSPNVVGGGKRPFHTIIPAFLTKDGAPVMSFGVMGGDMQPQGHLQTVVRMLDYHQQPQAACDAPRWKVNRDFTLDVEGTMCPATVAALEARGHRLKSVNDPYMDFGSGQFIWRQSDDLEDGYIAASDSRRDGHAAAF